MPKLDLREAGVVATSNRVPKPLERDDARRLGRELGLVAAVPKRAVREDRPDERVVGCIVRPGKNRHEIQYFRVGFL